MVPDLVQLKITSGICSVFAIGMTCFRLYMRRGRFWWDDACAFLSMIFLLAQIVSVFMHAPNSHVLTHADNIAAYYLMAATFYAIIWTARLAILYCVIRIDPNPKARLILRRVAIIFIIIPLVMIAQVLWVCEPMPNWKNAASPQCPLTKQVAICQLVTDILSDGLLIAAPLRLIRGMSAADGTRRRLMIIFSTSIVTTIVSLVHATFILVDGGIRVVIAAIVEDTFSLIVCNLPVVATAIMRKAGKNEKEIDYSRQSTLRFRVPTRNTATTAGSRNSDMAADLTPFNLRDFRMHAIATTRDVTLTRPDQTRMFEGGNPEAAFGQKDEAESKAKQQRSIVWIMPDDIRQSESLEDNAK